MPLSLSAAAAFAALTLALAAIWMPGTFAPSRAIRPWMIAGALAVALALPAGLIDVRGLLALLACAVACGAAARMTTRAGRIAAHALMLVLCAGLFLHLLPGFDNPVVVSNVVLGPGSLPYTKYLNFDKGMAGLFLLGLYTRAGSRRPSGLRSPTRHARPFLWRFAVLAATVLALSLALGYVRWDPKLPPWWGWWLWRMAALTALPEEALFRGVAQSSLETWLGRAPHAAWIATVTAGVLFGIAHVAGGPAYVVLATVAGIGYGWVYASTRSIGAAIAAHTGLNALHFLLFSYPALGF